MRRPEAAAAAVYAAGLVWLGRALTVDYHDGLAAILNGLLLFHAAPVSARFDAQRPPLGWVLMAAPLSWVYARFGALAALRACHALMPLWLAALALLTYTLAARVASKPAAAAAALLLAANPLTLQYAPFALLDIVSGVAAAVFAHAALTWAREPSPRARARLCAAGVAAALAKYPLAALMLGPAAVALWAPRGTLPARLRAAAPLALTIPLAGGIVLAVVCLLSAAVEPAQAAPALARSASRLWTDLSWNAWARDPAPRGLYLSSLLAQLGWPGALVALAGLAAWLKEERGGRVLAAAFLLQLLAMTVVGWKEQRYAIPLLPFAYAALAGGLDYLAGLMPKETPVGARTAALAILVLAFAPWNATAAAVRALRADPAFTTSLPWDLARRLEGAAPCVKVTGDARWLPSAKLLAYEQVPSFNASTLSFYAAPGLRLDSAGVGCPVSVTLAALGDGPVAAVSGAERAELTVAGARR